MESIRFTVHLLPPNRNAGGMRSMGPAFRCTRPFAAPRTEARSGLSRGRRLAEHVCQPALSCRRSAVGDHAKVKFFEPAFIFVGISSARVTLGFPRLGLVLNSESSNGL